MPGTQLSSTIDQADDQADGQPDLEQAPSARILLVEDEPAIGELVTAGLTFQGYTVDLAPSATVAREALASTPYDLAMLDVRLPDGSGLELCGEIRSTSDMPVMIVSVADSLEDRLAGFDAGADDYVVKPFYARELAFRVAALLRRSHVHAEEEVLSGPRGLQLDLRVGDAVLDGRRVRLTRSEAGVLAALLRSPGSAVSAEEMCRQVWRYESIADANFVQQHISRLRRKLRQLGLPRDVIRTIYGVGYAVDTGPGEAEPEQPPE